MCAVWHGVWNGKTTSIIIYSALRLDLKLPNPRAPRSHGHRACYHEWPRLLGTGQLLNETGKISRIKKSHLIKPQGKLQNE